jgi:hypothetical protein
MAIVNAEYKFIYVVIGQPGRTSDGRVFARIRFFEKLIRKGLQIPNEAALVGTEIKTLYVLIGHDAFCLSENLMKPHPGIQSKGSCQCVFNYRLFQARRVAKIVSG